MYMGMLHETDLEKLHQLVQPLNVIQMTCGNIRVRLSHAGSEDASYVIAKVERIEEQLARATQLLQEMTQSVAGDGTPDII